ncbi:MAG: flavodoxin domain-containing protein [Candidatus Thermoplasmatota archaeon]
MKYVIVYWSRYGNGKKIVERLSEKLKERKADIQILTTDEVNPSALPPADTYIFSAPTEAYTITRNMKKIMKKLQGVDGKKYGIINTHAMKKNWLPQMEKLLSKKNMIKIAEVDFLVQGDGVQKGHGLAPGWEAKLDEFAQKL